MNTNIVIADDHPIVREGVKRILSKNTPLNGYSVVGEANTIRELKEVLKNVQPDILTLDLSMPGGGGLEALVEIKRFYPEISILILSLHPESQYGLRAFKAGASGYLSKECVSENLVEALRTIASGKRYFGKVTGDLIFKELAYANTSNPLRHTLLSNRELHVLVNLAEGKTLTEISKDLSLSIKTISTYRFRVLKKLGIQTNTQMTDYVVQHKISPTI